MMRWWWFGPVTTPAEITRQLTAMQQAGIGGVELSVVYPLCTHNRIPGLRHQPYLSDAFRVSVRHAAEQARALGMRLDITLGSGWPFGGPHIPPDKGVWKLRVDSIPIPAGETPGTLPELGPNARLLAAAVVEAAPAARRPERLVESLEIGPDGRPRFTKPHDRDTELRLLVALPGGDPVKNAAVGAAGLVLDHYDPEALRLHLDAVARPLLDAAGRDPVRSIFCDSLEVYGANWTPTLFAEFKRRRGYDLEPHLSALFVGAGDHPARVRHDYGQTLTDLLNENFLKPLQAFAHANGVLSRVQAYGQPPAVLGSYRYVDVPEGEAARASDSRKVCSRADWTELTPNRIAASAALQQHKPIVSAETWTWLHSPPFAATPLDVKSEADQYFLQGVNRLIGHGWPYSPPQVERPGWMFYAAANFNDHNPWFPVMGDIAAYLQTVSHALSLGRRVGGVAIYLPVHDAWAGYKVTSPMPDLLMSRTLKNRVGEALPATLLRLGYTFDLIDDDGLAALAEGAEPAYAAVILPGVRRIPAETAEALCRIATRRPVVAVGRRPDRAPGLQDGERKSARVDRCMRDLFEGDAGGIVIRTPADLPGLRAVIPSTVSFERPHPDVGYLHRRLDQGELFFFANTSHADVAVRVTFRLSSVYSDATKANSAAASRRTWKSLAMLNPLTGRRTALMHDPASQASTVTLTFQPFESLFVIADDDEIPEPGPSTPASSMDLSRDWRVRFSGTGIEKTLSTLDSWTVSPDTRHFSGEAVYAKELELDRDLLGKGCRVRLVLDGCRPVRPSRTRADQPNRGHVAFLDTPVKDAALVFVNGKRVGALWTPPYDLDITSHVAPGRNRIELRVYNRLVNHMASLRYAKPDHPYGDGLRGVDGVSALEPEASGLTGRVLLVVESTAETLQ